MGTEQSLGAWSYVSMTELLILRKSLTVKGLKHSHAPVQLFRYVQKEQEADGLFLLF